MEVKTTLRYLRKTVVELQSTHTVAEGCTAGALAGRIIEEHQAQAGINFTGASIAVLVNGRLAAEDWLLHDGDVMQILPVAAGG